MTLTVPDGPKWHQAVIAAMQRYSIRHGTRLIRRAVLIREELPQIVNDAGASGASPDQTLSRVLQELRGRGLIRHVDAGLDVLLDRPLDVEAEDLPDTALDAAIETEQIRIGDVDTGDTWESQEAQRAGSPS